MKGKQLFIFLVLATLTTGAVAQKIVYSDYEKDDSRRMNFEIVGKLNGNFMIYKNVRSKHWMVGLDNDMKQVFKTEQTYLPANDRMINSDFFAYNDFIYMVYQYQKKNVVYCMASKIDISGNQIWEPLQLDTTHLGFAADNKIYSVIGSEDKSKIGVFKINSRNRKLYIMTTILLNDRLEMLKKSVIEIPMEERNEDLSDFKLDNEGDLVFCKFLRNNNENITSATLLIKQAMGDTLVGNDLRLDKIMLDEINVKIDNPNKRYLLASLYYQERRGNVEGYYFSIWDKTQTAFVLNTTSLFSDELRKEARGDATLKTAFNDYFIRNIISKKDGGFIISAEAYYTTSRFNNWNRWDYLYGSPYYGYGSQNYYYSPFYRNWWNYPRYNTNQSARYHADNITVLSYKPGGELEWSCIVSKEQYDDETDDKLSFQLMNTGGQLHFLFNQLEKRYIILNDYSLSPDGSLTRNPTLKNLERGYEFLPQYGKQVSARQMIVPCLYRNYICFAKIDYN
ncbi:MAG: hypothetical protein IPH18_15265 [Chitinophagaceae bacterium]|nr:hypothetical protein [Chitinophagaceae bacterium]